MKKFQTEQEDFWAGKFGDNYIKRNRDKSLVAANIFLFSKILARTKNVHSIIEFGPNIGLNLLAIKNLLPKAKLSGVEINKKAALELKKIKDIIVYHKSILDFKPTQKRDFVLTKGLLIHINPDKLNLVYDIVYKTSKKYICLVEYYNPTPVQVCYRGSRDKLFKRDFAGEMLKRFKDLTLVDYGFVYHGDNNFPLDDGTWFLLEK